MFQNTQFSGSRVKLDGKAFKGCTFTNCVLVYEGAPGTVLTNNQLVNCTIEFEGAALAGMQFIAQMAQCAGGKPMAEKLLRQIIAAIKPGAVTNVQASSSEAKH